MGRLSHGLLEYPQEVRRTEVHQRRQVCQAERLVEMGLDVLLHQPQFVR